MNETIDDKIHSNRFFQNCNSIISHYTCPVDCLSHCCRTSEITFGGSEYKRITRKYPQTKIILKTKSEIQAVDTIGGYDIEAFVFTEKPCPLLSSKNLCEIQGAKPYICQLYPFVVGKGAPHGYITIEPCPLGKLIILDFLMFKFSLVMASTQLSDLQKRAIFKDDFETIAQVIIGSEEFEKMKRVPLMHVSILILDEFNRYMNETSPAILRTQREIFRKLTKMG